MGLLVSLFPKAALQGLDQLLHPVAVIALSSYLIPYLGPEGYALLSLSIMSYGFFSLLCPNALAAVYAHVPPQLAPAPHRPNITELLFALLALLFVSVVTTWTALVLAAHWVPAGRLLKALASPITSLPILLFALFFNIDQAVSALARMLSSLEVTSAIDLTGKALSWAAIIVLLPQTHTNPLSLLYVLCMALGVTSTIKLLRCRHALDFSCWRVSRRTWQSLFATAFWPWLLSVGIVVFSQADQFVMSAMFGPAEAALVVLLSLIGRVVHSLTSASFAFLFPYLASISATSSRGIAIARLSQLANLVIATSVAASLYLMVAYLVSPPHGLFFRIEDAVPFILANLVLSLHVASWNHLMALGAVRQVALTLLAAGTANSLTVLALAPTLGPDAVWLGRLLAGIIMLALIARSIATLRRPLISQRAL
jgi:O-antigen/teichoic acid export membrane protein